MKLTTSEQSAVLLKVAREFGLSVETITRKVKDGTDENLVNRFVDRVNAEQRTLETTKLKTRGNGAYAEMKKALKSLMNSQPPTKLYEMSGGNPKNFQTAFRTGQVRNIFEAIELYTATKKHTGRTIHAREAELNFLNQDVLLVKKAREYVKSLGLSLK